MVLEADDIGMARRQLQHAAAHPRDQQPGPPSRLRLESVDAVEAAVECHWPVADEARLEDLHRFREPCHSNARWIERQARAPIVGLHPAGADPQLEAAVGQQIDRGGLLRQQRRMAEVVVEHDGADTQARCGGRRVQQRWQWRQLLAEVVG